MFLLGDWVGIVTASGLFLGTFGVGEMLRYRARWASERTRKLAHIGSGIIVCFFPGMFSSVHTVGFLSATFLLLLLTTRLLGFMQSIHAVRRNTGGIFYYPIAIYATALLTWDTPVLFQICVMLLAFADGLAALVGKAYGRHRYRLGAHLRTLEGSATVLGVSWLATALPLAASGTARPGAAALIGALVAGLVCAVEALSLWGTDNLLIPLVAAVFLKAAIAWPVETLYWHFGAATVALGVATACQLKGYLRLNGAVAAWLVGYVTLGLGGVAWFGPLLAFFLAINVAGKVADRALGRRPGGAFERLEEKGGRRDFVQVFANTGVCLALTAVHAATRESAPRVAELAFWAYIGSLCAASADTFASELGVLARARPVLLWTFEPVPTGLSGGVTAFGYGAAALGALVPVATLAVVGSPYPMGALALAGALASGLFGSTVDSLAGATLQFKRRCEACGKVLEKPTHCDRPTLAHGGLPWVSNDVVNAWGALAGAAAGAVFFGLWGMGG